MNVYIFVVVLALHNSKPNSSLLITANTACSNDELFIALRSSLHMEKSNVGFIAMYI